MENLKAYRYKVIFTVTKVSIAIGFDCEMSYQIRVGKEKVKSA